MRHFSNNFVWNIKQRTFLLKKNAISQGTGYTQGYKLPLSPNNYPLIAGRRRSSDKIYTTIIFKMYKRLCIIYLCFQKIIK